MKKTTKPQGYEGSTIGLQRGGQNWQYRIFLIPWLRLLGGIAGNWEDGWEL